MHHLNIAPQMADHRLFLLLTALSVAALVILLAVLIRRSRSSSKHHRLARMATGGLVVLILAGFAPAVLHQSEENQQQMAAAIAAEATEQYGLEVPEKVVGVALQDHKIGRWRAVFPDGTGWEMVMVIDKDEQRMRIMHGADYLEPGNPEPKLRDNKVKAATSIVINEYLNKVDVDEYVEKIADLQL